MNKRRMFGLGPHVLMGIKTRGSQVRMGIMAGALLGALVVTGIACRQEGPTEDPKTPPNSPIPDIDRKDEDPKASPAPAPGVGDAG